MSKKAGRKAICEFQALSFDCYGTLIDYKEGIRRGLEEEGLLESLPASFEQFLEQRSAKERELQGAAYRHYREILALSFGHVLRSLGMEIDDRTALRLADSIGKWPPFPDTVSALRRLGSHWPLMIFSNVDRAPLLETVQQLGIPFADLVSAEDVRSYKPDRAHFELGLGRLEGETKPLHVAASLEHDIEVATKLDVQCVWVNREGIDPKKVELPNAARGDTLMVSDLNELVDQLIT